MHTACLIHEIFQFDAIELEKFARRKVLMLCVHRHFASREYLCVCDDLCTCIGRVSSFEEWLKLEWCVRALGFGFGGRHNTAVCVPNLFRVFWVIRLA